MESQESSTASSHEGNDTNKRRKQSHFQSDWELAYFVVVDSGRPTCLICSLVMTNVKRYNFERHCKTRNPQEFSLHEDDRLKRFDALKAEFFRQEVFTEGNEAAVKVSYHKALKIAQKGRAFGDGELITECMLTAAHILCPKESTKFDSEVTGVHCILHRENLCAQNVKMNNVMTVAVKAVNFIRAHGLNHRQFKGFLEDIEAEYCDVPYYCEVRWLSRGEVLKRFFTLREEISLFMEMKGKPVPELQSTQWVTDLAFLADLTHYLNILNSSLQGEGQIITELIDKVTAFRMKFSLWETQLGAGNTAHLPNLLSICAAANDTNLSDYVVVLPNINKEFNDRFKDLDKLQPTMEIFATPFSADAQSAPTEFQMELIDLQCDRMLKEKYRACDGQLVTFYTSFPRTRFPNLHRLPARNLSMFGTTYLCEKFFLSDETHEITSSWEAD